VLGRGSDQSHVALSPLERTPDTYRIGHRVGPRAGLKLVGNRRSISSARIRILDHSAQPIHYTVHDTHALLSALHVVRMYPVYKSYVACFVCFIAYVLCQCPFVTV
jgi:hypothetical protein